MRIKKIEFALQASITDANKHIEDDKNTRQIHKQ